MIEQNRKNTLQCRAGGDPQQLQGVACKSCGLAPSHETNSSSNLCGCEWQVKGGLQLCLNTGIPHAARLYAKQGRKVLQKGSKAGSRALGRYAQKLPELAGLGTA